MERFAREGAKVIMIDLPNSPGVEVAEALGPNVLFSPADVTKEDQVRVHHCACLIQ